MTILHQERKKNKLVKPMDDIMQVEKKGKKKLVTNLEYYLGYDLRND